MTRRHWRMEDSMSSSAMTDPVSPEQQAEDEAWGVLLNATIAYDRAKPMRVRTSKGVFENPEIERSLAVPAEVTQAMWNARDAYRAAVAAAATAPLRARLEALDWRDGVPSAVKCESCGETATGAINGRQFCSNPACVKAVCDAALAFSPIATLRAVSAPAQEPPAAQEDSDGR